MEIDLVYLQALIEECDDPVAICERSSLQGERDSVAAARNTLLRHLGKPAVYDLKSHAAHLHAIRLLGVDVSTDEALTVNVLKRANSTPWSAESSWSL